MYQPVSGKSNEEPVITVNDQNLTAVDQFTYLGSTLSQVVHIDAEINSRFSKASAAFGRLCEKVWDRTGIRVDTKFKVKRCGIGQVSE